MDGADNLIDQTIRIFAVKEQSGNLNFVNGLFKMEHGLNARETLFDSIRKMNFTPRHTGLNGLRDRIKSSHSAL